MADITAEQVKQLRERTGAGMMDCKRALQETDGDVDRAIELLREKGLASVAKRADRAANQGLVDSYIHFNNTVGVLVEVNCETDFVANTDEFRALVKDVALHIASPASPRWLRREDVPEDRLAQEEHIWRVQAKESGKPDQVIDRIVEGKRTSFFEDGAAAPRRGGRQGGGEGCRPAVRPLQAWRVGRGLIRMPSGRGELART
jgi:elongation factor Ts